MRHLYRASAIAALLFLGADADQYPYSFENVLRSSMPRHVQFVDVDLDGDNDLFAVSKDHIHWYENRDGKATSLLIRHVASNFAVNTAAMGDINGDGSPDIVGVGRYHGLIWWKSVGKGRAWEQVTIGAEINGDDAQIGDIDGDGDMDVVYCSAKFNDGIYWIENADGKGMSWSSPSAISETDSVKSIKVVDFDNDKDWDVVSSNFIYKNDRGPWSKIPLEFGGVTRANDFDMDGDVDLLVVNSRHITLYENLDGKGQFAPQPLIFSPPNIRKDWLAAAADVDGDGDADLICAEHSYETGLLWYENADGDWTKHLIKRKWEGPRCLDVGDFDGDGDMDFAAGSYHGRRISWYENKSNATRNGK